MDNSPAPSLDHEIEDQDDGDESLDMENNGGLILEQDRFLPIANVSRIMKRMIPSSGKMSKESKECVQECVSEFISFITSEASERCYQEKRKTITYEDLLSAMQSLGFDNYIEPLTIYMDRFHEVDKTGRVSSAPSNAGSVPPSPAMPVNKHVMQQDDRSQGHHEQSASHSQHHHQQDQQDQHHNMHHTGHHQQVGVVQMDEHHQQQQQQAHHSHHQPRAVQYVAGGGGKMQAMQQHHQMVEDVMDGGEQEVGGDGEEEQLQPLASQNVHQIQQVPIYVDPSSGQHYMVMSNPEGGGDILMQIQITSDGNAQPIQLVDGDAQMVDMRDDEIAAGEQGELLEEAAVLQPPPPRIPPSQPTPTHETSPKKQRFHYY